MDSPTVPPEFFAHLQTEGQIEVALLLRRNGHLLAAWAKNPIAWDVMSIMAATTLGSMDTMLETLGVPPPQTIVLAASGVRILLQKVEPKALLLLVAKENVTEACLRDAALRILGRLLSPSNGEPTRRVTLGPNLR